MATPISEDHDCNLCHSRHICNPNLWDEQAVKEQDTCFVPDPNICPSDIYEGIKDEND